MAKLTKKAANQLREHLTGQPAERLVDLLMAEVEHNPALADQLLLEIAEAGVPLDLGQFRRSFSAALRSRSAAGGGRSYPRTSGPWAREVHGSIERIRSLLASQPQAVIELTEHALGRVDKAMSTIDDSSGYFSQIVADLERLHHDACVTVRPDPVGLARRLFAFDVDGEWDIFIDSVERYADVLGEEGIAELRRLAEARWAELPQRPPGSGFDPTPGRFHLERMMEKLALHAGDVDARVAVLSRDLAHPYDFLKVAEVLAEAGRHDDGLEWAQRGLIAFAGDARGPDTRLDDFVLAAYVERGRTDDVVDLVWQRFEQRLTAGSYARLRRWTAAVDRWTQVQPRALQRLRDEAERAAGSAPGQPSPYHTLIAVALHDDAVDEAWALAVEHGCSDALWLELAEAREADHPLDAAAVYQREVEHLIDYRQPRTYEAAAQLVAHVAGLLRAAGRSAEADDYLADVRRRHKVKTTFLGFLTAAGL